MKLLAACFMLVDLFFLPEDLGVIFHGNVG
jgi:hypothetical protein